MKRSFYHVVHNLGPQQLALTGRADRNDCLDLDCFSNNPDESFHTTENKKGGTAESVFIGGMFILYGGEYGRVLRKLKKDGEADEFDRHISAMRKALDTSGWDGEWSIRA